MNGATIEAWVEQSLAPELPEQAVVVMDDLSAHKGARVRELLEAAGQRGAVPAAVFPDLNPIEQAFAELKHLLRLARRRTTDELWDDIGALLDRFEPPECADYLANSGYRIN